MTAHSRILAWRIPWTEESGRLQSKGPQKDMTEMNYHAHEGYSWKSTHRMLFVRLFTGSPV